MSKIQIGASLSGDLKENTWTFEMQEEMSLIAGKFALIPLDDFDEIKDALNKAKAILQSMGVKTTDRVGGEIMKHIYSTIEKINN